MNPPSHWLMTAALGKRLRHLPIAPSAFLLGSVAPDMPLYHPGDDPSRGASLRKDDA